MKKRILAWVLLLSLLLSLLLTACAPADPGTTGGAPTTPPTEPGGVSTDIPAATEPSIQIHYQRNDGAYNEWGFWIWEMGGDGGEDQQDQDARPRGETPEERVTETLGAALKRVGIGSGIS